LRKKDSCNQMQHPQHQEILTFLVENNEEILEDIKSNVLLLLEEVDLEDAVQETLKDYLISKFELNYLEVFDIIDNIEKEPFKSLYYRIEYYNKKGTTLH